MPITALICDLDGLLTDTESLHFKSYIEVFGPIGVPLTELEYADHWIRQGRGIDDFVRQRKLTCDPETIRQQKIAAYTKLVKAEVQPMAGAVALLDRFAGSKRLALATSAYRISAGEVLASLRLADQFEVIVCGDEVTHKKPHPEIFLTTAKKLRVAPEECVVLEDAEKGVRAARAAGMACIAVPNRFTKENDFSDASLIVESLDNITATTLDSLTSKVKE